LSPADWLTAGGELARRICPCGLLLFIVIVIIIGVIVVIIVLFGICVWLVIVLCGYYYCCCVLLLLLLLVRPQPCVCDGPQPSDRLPRFFVTQAGRQTGSEPGSAGRPADGGSLWAAVTDLEGRPIVVL